MNHKKDSLEKEHPKKVPLISFGIYIMSLGDIHFTQMMQDAKQGFSAWLWSNLPGNFQTRAKIDTI